MIQIISPHIDDAILSLGGNIIKWLNDGEAVHIYYVFTISNWTNENAISGKSYDKNIENITSIRKQEENQISQKLQYTYECLDFLDLPLRTDKTINETQYELQELLKSKVNPDSLIFFPLASGLRSISHLDHNICRNTGIKFREEGYNIAFYEDLPYMATEKSLIEKSNSLKQQGLEAVYTKIDIIQKTRLFNIYTSQISIDWRMLLNSYSYSMQDNTHYERYWK